jgi:hypothetical protein
MFSMLSLACLWLPFVVFKYIFRWSQIFGGITYIVGICHWTIAGGCADGATFICESKSGVGVPIGYRTIVNTSVINRMFILFFYSFISFVYNVG